MTSPSPRLTRTTSLEPNLQEPLSDARGQVPADRLAAPTDKHSREIPRTLAVSSIVRVVLLRQSGECRRVCLECELVFLVVMR